MRATEKAALCFVEFLKTKKPQKTALVVGLYGNLGAGKTTFTQAVAKQLGIKEKIQSPTFVIERIYEIPKKNFAFKRLIHIDAYRLQNPKELQALGFQKILKDKNNLIFIEWADKVFKILPKNHWQIFFYVK